MASNQPKAKQGSRWGSLLSGAVSGIESRLDTILGDDPEASAKSRQADKVILDSKATTSDGVSREASRNRVNERLQEKLAKAKIARAGSQVPSEVGTPPTSASPVVEPSSPRTSLGSRPSVDITGPTQEPSSQQEEKQDATLAEPSEEISDAPSTMTEPERTLLTSGLPINPARISQDSASRPSIEVSEPDDLNTMVETNGTAVTSKTPEELGAEIAQLKADHAEAEKIRQEEMHANLERIDALQAKLQYLAKETLAAAKEANASTSGTLEERIAEKDERIALLMEEGEKLSKTEMRHLATIRKLNGKLKTDEKSTSDLLLKVSKLEKSDAELRQKLRKLEQAERQNTERLKRLPRVEIELQSTKTELESSKGTMSSLRKQLETAEQRAQDADNSKQKAASLADSKKVSDLQDDLENAKLEKKLADERASAELRKAKEEVERQKQSSASIELEFTTEIQNLESKMETLRIRAEEASSDVGGDSQAKLLRQIETLQTQYSLAAENWRTIESSMNARMTAVERERDEASRRETDIRKKARDLGLKSRRLEEELEASADTARALTTELETLRSSLHALTTRLSTADKALEDTKADFDRQRKVWEAESAQRIEDEKRAQIPRTTSGSSFQRPSVVRKTPSRLFSNESLTIDPRARRSTKTSDLTLSPTVSRDASALSLANLNGLSTPVIQTPDLDSVYDDTETEAPSPGRTVNDVISATTMHTGPSVQLVERMSSSIRRLEAEKAAHKDEVARLQTQRDEARDQVVSMMREIEGLKTTATKSGNVEKELAATRARYEACLEMIGEREEEVAELKDDIADLKRVYRELANTMGK